MQPDIPPNPPMSLPFLERLLSWRAQGTLPIIAEIKMQSVSEGTLIKERTVEDIVVQYINSGAACISVVTGHWFGGDLKLFEKVRALTALPLLRKDFIVSRRDLKVSSELGADAVLLTRRLLNADALGRMAAEALAMGMVPFVEVADRQELATTVLPEDAVLAVNNRDIRIREADDGDYRNSLSLSDMAAGRRTKALVSASGIRTPGEVIELINAGFDGVLIGTALLRSADIARFFADARLNLHVGSHSGMQHV